MVRQVTLFRAWLIVVVLGSSASCQDRILHESKSAYNQVIVTEDSQGLRTLRFQEGGARQSVVKLDDPDHLELPYTRVMPVALAFVERPKRVLIVGLGGGTIPTFLRKHFPETEIDVVDIDPVVVEVAREYFGFREDPLLRARSRWTKVRGRLPDALRYDLPGCFRSRQYSLPFGDAGVSAGGSPSTASGRNRCLQRLAPIREPVVRFDVADVHRRLSRCLRRGYSYRGQSDRHGAT